MTLICPTVTLVHLADNAFFQCCLYRRNNLSIKRIEELMSYFPGTRLGVKNTSHLPPNFSTKIQQCHQLDAVQKLFHRLSTDQADPTPALSPTAASGNTRGPATDSAQLLGSFYEMDMPVLADESQQLVFLAAPWSKKEFACRPEVEPERN